jgi:hypothetical protein
MNVFMLKNINFRQGKWYFEIRNFDCGESRWPLSNLLTSLAVDHRSFFISFLFKKRDDFPNRAYFHLTLRYMLHMEQFCS